MKRLKNMFFSMELTGMLLLLFAIAIGFATFVENDFGTLVAKARIYNAKWFELLLLLLAINMTGSIFKHKMYLRHKWPVLLFHAAFLVIFIGAATTRYIGFEGMMNIREGTTSNQFRSDETYVRIWAERDGQRAYKEEKVFAIAEQVRNVEESLTLGTDRIHFEVEDYFFNAAETYVEGEGGEPVLMLVISGQNTGRKNLYLKKGEQNVFNGYRIGFDAGIDSTGISISSRNDSLYITAPDSLEHMNMMTNTTTTVDPGDEYPLQPMNLYQIGGVSIVLRQFYESAVVQLVSTDGQEGMSSMDAFKAQISVNGTSRTVNVFGGKGFLGETAELDIDGIRIAVSYGSKLLQLPFSIRLEDFQLERYPGSNSPSSYASEVTVIDEASGDVFPYRIFMNNVLNYKGYRFFQSSYDRDEKGTILSVNHDAPGTILTYIGYLLMTIGMVMAIFSRHSRFKSLFRLSAQVRKSRESLTVVILLIALTLIPVLDSKGQSSGQPVIPEIDPSHSESFGELLVQDRDGRIKPVNTIASEVLRKIARKNSFEGQTPEQIFLGIMVYPEIWENVPFIKISHPQLKDFLGVEGKYARFTDLVELETTGHYKINEYVERAYAKKPANQSKFDKDVMHVDERVNVFYMVYSGTFLTIFPLPADENHTWVNASKSNLFKDEDESLFVNGILPMYFDEVRKAVQSGDWTAANEHLGYLKKFQEKYGGAVLPSESRVNLEIFYNKFNIFKRLSGYYGIIGFILIVLHFIQILNPRIRLRTVIRISSIIVVILFLLHTAGLIIRWNISGHAPWSNGYESLIYIAWATTLSGLIFVWRSEITLSVTALLSSLILAVAGMSWMDPEITNLVPVLKSYWLIIHVAIITASYGFLALGALLGFFNLLLINFKTKKNVIRLNMTITELAYIIEMTLIIGLFMLTIGTFLGGVWANESWGRYWGWDPKETWALATVLFYSFVVHMRFIPGFRGSFAFSFAALITFSSVIMTYFGVNYYLSGLHSYAAGDPVPIPNFVYYTVIVIGVVGILAFINDRRVKSVKEGNDELQK